MFLNYWYMPDPYVKDMIMVTNVLVHLNSWGHFTHTHAHMKKTNNSPVCVYVRENLEKRSSKVPFWAMTWVMKWVSFECIWFTLYHERWRQVLRQRKLTTERTVIKETLPPNGVREVGIQRFNNDFHYLFIVWQSYYADGLTVSNFISMQFSTIN